MWKTLSMFGYQITAKVFEHDSGLGYGVFHRGRVSYLLVSKGDNELFFWDRHIVEDGLPHVVVKSIVRLLEWMS